MPRAAFVTEFKGHHELPRTVGCRVAGRSRVMPVKPAGHPARDAHIVPGRVRFATERMDEGVLG